MPDTYTHPNGYTVERDADGRVILDRDGDAWVTPETAAALRDFFLAELGLWRDDETGALVVVDSWDGSSARVIALPDDGDDDAYAPSLGILDSAAPDRCDAVVTRWRASLTPPPREPKPGEVWRITLEDGTGANALVVTGVLAGRPPRFHGQLVDASVPEVPADRRLLLVEANGTVASDD